MMFSMIFIFLLQIRNRTSAATHESEQQDSVEQKIETVFFSAKKPLYNKSK